MTQKPKRKGPPNVPDAVGNIVKLRGTDNYGLVLQINSNNWVQVSWVDKGPKICHLFELEKCNVDSTNLLQQEQIKAVKTKTE